MDLTFQNTCLLNKYYLCLVRLPDLHQLKRCRHRNSCISISGHLLMKTSTTILKALQDSLLLLLQEYHCYLFWNRSLFMLMWHSWPNLYLQRVTLGGKRAVNKVTLILVILKYLNCILYWLFLMFDAFDVFPVLLYTVLIYYIYCRYTPWKIQKS